MAPRGVNHLVVGSTGPQRDRPSRRPAEVSITSSLPVVALRSRGRDAVPDTSLRARYVRAAGLAVRAARRSLTGELRPRVDLGRPPRARPDTALAALELPAGSDPVEKERRLPIAPHHLGRWCRTVRFEAHEGIAPISGERAPE